MQLEVTNRQIIKIAAPICLALVVPQINHMTNIAFVGRLGEFELAANGIAGIYYLVMYMIAYGLNNGMQVLIARRAGQLNYSGIGQLFSNGMILGTLFSLLAIGITLLMAPYFFSKSLHDPHIYEAALSFIRIRIWGLPLLMLLGMANAFYIGSGHTRVLVITSLCQEFVNIYLDYSLIFGKLGMPALGLNGAAYASIAAEATGMIVAYTIILVNRFHHKFRLFSYLRPDFEMMKHILSVSAPLIVQFLFSIGSWFVFFIFIEHLGNRPLAISNMLRSVLGFFGIFVWALAAACNTLVSNIIGQGKEDLVFTAIRKVVTISVICGLVVCLLLNLLPHVVLHIYTNDATLIKEAIPSMRIVTLSTLVMAVSAIVFNGVTGTGNTKMNLLIEFTAVICYMLYCTIVVERMHSPLYVAWLSDFVYWIIILLMCIWYLRSGRWRNKAI